MDISIVSPDLSHNCLVRSHLLAEILNQRYDIEIVGPKLRGKVWEPVAGDYNYKGIDMSQYSYEFLFEIPSLLDLIDGDLIYASKPRVSSFGISLIKSVKEDRPLILDIDDWESGLNHIFDQKIPTYFAGIPLLLKHESYYFTRTMETMSKKADLITVSNEFLREKFEGDTVVPHIRDTEEFDPNDFNKCAVREELGLPTDEFLLIFSGTPRPHKGIKDLVLAVNSIPRDDISIVLVGANDSRYMNHVQELSDSGTLILKEPQPFNSLPKWIAAADIIPIPQKETYSTMGQTPAKLIDAMAMGKPIVATNLPTINEVLGSCGILVDPSSPDQLAAAIQKYINNPAYRNKMGLYARQRCIDKYSFKAVSPRLFEVIDPLL